MKCSHKQIEIIGTYMDSVAIKKHDSFVTLICTKCAGTFYSVGIGYSYEWDIEKDDQPTKFARDIGDEYYEYPS